MSKLQFSSSNLIVYCLDNSNELSIVKLAKEMKYYKKGQDIFSSLGIVFTFDIESSMLHKNVHVTQKYTGVLSSQKR